jgi:hypothetical protein
MPIRLTPPMKQRLTRRTLAMLQRSLGHFPELKEATITVGYTRKHLGSATVIYRSGALVSLIIRLRARKVTYQTIGHELTHLIQGLAYGDRTGARSVDPEKIPSGEKQCDIWTLARDLLFCDDAPTYIKMPRLIRERWADYALSVRDLCIAAIEKRHIHRQYIRWLEDEISKLPRALSQEKIATAQMTLPFVF